MPRFLRLSPKLTRRGRIARVGAQTLLLGAGMLPVAWAQSVTDPGDPGLKLQSSERLEENVTAAQRRNAPVFLMGDRISGRPDLETVIEGHAELRKADTLIRSDRLEYDAPTDQARAIGNVRVQRKATVTRGRC